ncbi:MAG: TIGR03546 family protein [Rheinheimera sp.]|uniref:TIGR03546 family protein n=1 Tax=Arsukibacterium sp. UBA3155 TaxID=1946058 RepID=UPI000C94ECA3|nr:TIGR03546 family protein [Arsukibacterium sp. UBA3155]MAD75493.1 TIGR03546 family protein [Rheinheimera sp.]|tara:strand:- start:100712 stop:101203 length:492 start_codon:yes stop_codon:yes gene_type:complete
MLTLFARILKVLNSEASPWQIGWAIGLGLLAGLLPFGILTLLIILLVCLFTVNLATFILVWGLCSGLMFIFGDSLEALTWQYAQSPALLQLLAQSETLQMLHLHHTLVLGAFVLGMLLLVPVAWLGTILVKQYRGRVMSKLQQWKVVQMLKASKLVQLYENLN